MASCRIAVLKKQLQSRRGRFDWTMGSGETECAFGPNLQGDIGRTPYTVAEAAGGRLALGDNGG